MDRSQPCPPVAPPGWLLDPSGAPQATTRRRFRRHPFRRVHWSRLGFTLDLGAQRAPAPPPSYLMTHRPSAAAVQERLAEFWRPYTRAGMEPC